MPPSVMYEVDSCSYSTRNDTGRLGASNLPNKASRRIPRERVARFNIRLFVSTAVLNAGSARPNLQLVSLAKFAGKFCTYASSNPRLHRRKIVPSWTLVHDAMNFRRVPVIFHGFPGEGATRCCCCGCCCCCCCGCSCCWQMPSQHASRFRTIIPEPRPSRLPDCSSTKLDCLDMEERLSSKATTRHPNPDNSAFAAHRTHTMPHEVHSCRTSQKIAGQADPHATSPLPHCREVVGKLSSTTSLLLSHFLFVVLRTKVRIVWCRCFTPVSCKRWIWVGLAEYF
jgi:hypothetical protein